MSFVCNMGSNRYYIQSAYAIPDEEKHEQEIRPFRKIDDSKSRHSSVFTEVSPFVKIYL